MRKCRSLIAASLIGSVVVVLGLLSYAFVISIGIPAAQRAAPLATIATGIALVCVAALAYILQLRAHRLEERSFQAAHEPSLGILWQNRATYLSEEVVGADGNRSFYEEFVMWNAGDVPILLWQPSRIQAPELGPKRYGGRRVEVEKTGGGDSVAPRVFPIVLGKGETCIWREFTVHDAAQVGSPGGIVARTREEAVEFLRKQPGDIRFLYRVVYFSKPLADMSPGDIYEQYVGFSYRLTSHEMESRGRNP